MGKTIKKMKERQAIEEIAMMRIIEELRKAEEKFPGFPRDIVHCAGILVEETGEVMKSALDFHYGRTKDLKELEKEIAQAGAMAVRFLLRILDIYHYPDHKR